MLKINRCQHLPCNCKNSSGRLVGGNHSHLLVGDLNYPEVNWDCRTSSVVSQHNSKDLIDILQDSFLFQLVDKPTRYREGHKLSNFRPDNIECGDSINDIRYCGPLGKSDLCYSST